MSKTIKSSLINEEYQHITHSSGLEIILYPMKNFSGAYALFSTKYGSVDTNFRTSNEEHFTKVPEGIAHFLEHKLFESEKGDAFARYAQTGASANAYTSFDKTAYLFSCTDNFRASLEILLDFVTDPYFTPETVQKEQGIIGQEIKMYQDDPNWRVFFGLLNGMYHNNPVRIDIAGTVQSIAEIDDQLLYRCYNTFYNLNNMALVVAGNFDPNDVLELADEILKPAPKFEIIRDTPDEPAAIKSDYIEIVLPIAQPMFQLGFKGESVGEKEDFLNTIKLDILLDMIGGKSSPLYKKLYENGLINSTFGTSAESGRGFCYSVFDGESKDPKAVKEEILKEIETLKLNGLSEDSFDHCKKSAWGKLVSVYGSVSALASVALSSHFVGLDAYAMLNATKEVTFEEVENLFLAGFSADNAVLSVIMPTKK